MKKLFLLMLCCPVALAAQDLTIFLNKGYRLPSRVDAAGATEYRWTENGTEIPDSNTPSLRVAGKVTPGDYVYVRQAKFPDCEWVDAPAVTVRVTCTFDNFNPDPSAPAGYTWSVADARAGGNAETYTVTKQSDNSYITTPMKYGTTCKTSWPGNTNTTGVSDVLTIGACVNISETYYYTLAAALQSADDFDYTSLLTSGTYVKDIRGICPEGWYVYMCGKQTGKICDCGGNYCTGDYKAYDGGDVPHGGSGSSGALMTVMNPANPITVACCKHNTDVRTRNPYMIVRCVQP
ncbi:MAG: hypothetical protein LBT49_04370 [Prevotellaceae bacterium]|jgi:hypothetical protein|nr:hypothetical protein [Prevotellaceae bacterium]